ncbi:MAG TPA: hypothetical protein VMU95_18770 [Trebonia sp.]|nr:hypothetical protein [Trebonia sp.]
MTTLRSLGAWLRWGGAIVAAVALAALGFVGPHGVARAATTSGSYNQMTGIGLTSSSVTVPWTSGLRDSSNQPLSSSAGQLAPNSDRASASPTGPVSFMYPSFKNLVVTVSQTKDIGHGGVTVKWTGGVPTADLGEPQGNYLQMMECYGDATTGPDPEDCEYGSVGMFGSSNSSLPAYINSREGDLCGPGSANLQNPPRSANGDGTDYGCDPQEGQFPSHLAPCPGVDCSNDLSFSVPFDPVAGSGGSTAYGEQNYNQYFNEFDTDEVQFAPTNSSGDGQLQFETLTANEAPYLGCGQLESGGQPENCWLVIVPRGEYEPNGYKIQSGTTGAPSELQSSPLAASNWAQRIQVHLDFTPLQQDCPLSTPEVQTEGTQMITHAVNSWQLALNQQLNCKFAYEYSATPEGQATTDVTSPGLSSGDGNGLVFTTIPIGSEETRYTTGIPPDLPDIVYAPVAVAAPAFGFNIDEGPGGYDTTPVKLTPALMAKALTQVYRFDLPDYAPAVGDFPGPTWSQNNPKNITFDSEFQGLNPDVAPFSASGVSLAPLEIQDVNALSQQVWQWIDGNPTADSWLDGTPDKSDPVTADPQYVKAKLGKGIADDTFPRLYTGELNLGFDDDSNPPKAEVLGSTDLLPYTLNYDTGASTVVTAVDPGVSDNWNNFNIAPNNSPGYWSTDGPESPGEVFMWTVDDTPDLAAYGLVPAALCSGDGSNGTGSDCVDPSVASVGAALASAKKDSEGLIEVNPAKVPSGAYPLVDVIYAAVNLDQPAANLTDYADFIKYAAGAGQTAGSDPGDLPPGYMPLTSSLKAQANSVVNELLSRAGQHPSSPSGSGGAASSGAVTSDKGSTSVSGSTVGGGASSATTVPSVSPSELDVVPPSAQLAASNTPSISPGAVRDTLVVVVLGGLGSAGAGILLRSGRMPRRRSRRLPPRASP